MFLCQTLVALRVQRNYAGTRKCERACAAEAFETFKTNWPQNDMRYPNRKSNEMKFDQWF